MLNCRNQNLCRTLFLLLSFRWCWKRGFLLKNIPISRQECKNMHPYPLFMTKLAKINTKKGWNLIVIPFRAAYTYIAHITHFCHIPPTYLRRIVDPGCNWKCSANRICSIGSSVHLHVRNEYLCKGYWNPQWKTGGAMYFFEMISLESRSHNRGWRPQARAISSIGVAPWYETTLLFLEQIAPSPAAHARTYCEDFWRWSTGKCLPKFPKCLMLLVHNSIHSCVCEFYFNIFLVSC